MEVCPSRSRRVTKALRRSTLPIPLYLQSDFFPQDMILYITSKYEQKQPFISAKWLTPDGRTIRITNLAIVQKQTYRFAQDEKLKTSLKTEDVIPKLFTIRRRERSSRENISSRFRGRHLNLNSDMDMEFVFHGQVYGLAGTDQARRDLMRASAVGHSGGAGIRTDRLPRHCRADDGHRRAGNLVRRLVG